MPASRLVRTVVLSPRAAATLLALYVLALALVVFWPTGRFSATSIAETATIVHRLGAPAWVTLGEVGAALNVLLFAPFSFLGHVLRPRWRWADWLVAGLAASVTIEVTQGLFLSGRQPSVVDIAANSLGALAGYLLARLLLRPRQRRTTGDVGPDTAGAVPFRR